MDMTKKPPKRLKPCCGCLLSSSARNWDW